MNKPLTIEIYGTGTHNRGAELMAIAVAERLRESFPGVRIVVPQSFGSTKCRQKHAFLTTWETGPWINLLSEKLYRKLLPTSIANYLYRIDRLARFLVAKTGLSIQLSEQVDPCEIDVVLDASGFAFSDQWGPNPAKGLQRHLEQRPNSLLILLPQAMGPFTKDSVVSGVNSLFSRASLVFARDNTSFDAVTRLAPSLRHFYQSPDFTLAVKPIRPKDMTLPEKFTAIVPNYRMIDKGSKSDEYLDFLRAAIDTLDKAGKNPAFILHDAHGDMRVIHLLGQKYSSYPIFTDSDPRVLKAMLGHAEFVIASRFHAIVSSLSQGIPCIGAGWSHKYPELFAEFGCPELLINDLQDRKLISETLLYLSDESSRLAVQQKIIACVEIIKPKTIDMWRKVEDLIRLTIEKQP